MKEKVFNGNVNGKTFKSEKEFHEAALKAMKEGGNLSISSSYTEVDTPKKVSNILTDKSNLPADTKEVERFNNNIKMFNETLERHLDFMKRFWWFM